MDTLLSLLGMAGCNYIMGVPGAVELPGRHVAGAGRMIAESLRRFDMEIVRDMTAGNLIGQHPLNGSIAPLGSALRSVMVRASIPP